MGVHATHVLFWYPLSLEVRYNGLGVVLVYESLVQVAPAVTGAPAVEYNVEHALSEYKFTVLVATPPEHTDLL